MANCCFAMCGCVGDNDRFDLVIVMTPSTLTAWRTERGWNRSEAARQLGAARNSVIAWETGRSAIPLYIELACRELARENQPEQQE